MPHHELPPDEPRPEGARRCPICRDAMVVFQIVHDVRGETCPSHGVWLDVLELETLEYRTRELTPSPARRRPLPQGDAAAAFVEYMLYGTDGSTERRQRARIRRHVAQASAPKLQHRNDAVVRSGSRLCPVCDAIMPARRRRDPSGRTPSVVVDTCRPHGSWFDLTEIEVLLHRVKDEERNRRR